MTACLLALIMYGRGTTPRLMVSDMQQEVSQHARLVHIRLHMRMLQLSTWVLKLEHSLLLRAQLWKPCEASQFQAWHASCM